MLRAWASGDDRWLRRTAVIAQLRSGADTDLDLLRYAVEATVEDPDLFLRKAVGWALRRHSRVDPTWVRRLVETHPRLSPLSRREATRHLPGWVRPMPGNAHEEHHRRATVADVRTGRVLGMLVVAAVASGCATVVTGSGRAVPEPVVDAPTTSASPVPTTAPAPPPGPRPALAADVLADECLLDALGFSDLLGVPVLPPEQAEVQRDDGSVGSSCVATSARGPADPLASINVYEPRDATPAEFVRSAPARGTTELTGAGEAAALLDTAPGVTLQLAGTRYVVTISVSGGAPSQEAWRAAATAVLAALPA